MSTTLDAIETALYTHLQTLGANGATPTGALPFRTVARWSGEVSADEIVEGHLGVCPSALLAWEGSEPVARNDGAYVETVSHDVEIVEEHRFRVYVTVQDTRGDTASLKGGTGTPGIHACTQAVVELLAGLRVAGLLDGGVVQLVGRKPWRIARGESVTHLVRFSCRACLPDLAETLPGAPMTRLDASINDASEDVDARDVPLATSRTLI